MSEEDIDWAYAVHLLMPGADWRRSETYEALAESWLDEREIPSKAALLAALQTHEQEAAKVPTDSIVTKRQLRLAMLALETPIRDGDIRLKLADNEAGLINWEDAVEIQRGHPLVLALAAAFSLSDDDVDNLWRAAGEIV